MLCRTSIAFKYNCSKCTRSAGRWVWLKPDQLLQRAPWCEQIPLFAWRNFGDPRKRREPTVMAHLLVEYLAYICCRCIHLHMLNRKCDWELSRLGVYSELQCQTCAAPSSARGIRRLRVLPFYALAEPSCSLWECELTRL